MAHLATRTAAAASVLTLSLAVLATGCGNQDSATENSSSSPSSGPSSSAATAADVPDGPWLVGVTSAGGADAETTSVTYISYTPSTGQATARTVPGIPAGTGDGADAALLVSADQKWAVPDLDVARSETRGGQVTVFSTTDQSTKKLDLRALTGQRGIKPVAHAFDPQRPEVLRVVDDANRVWAVDVASGRATSEGRLAGGPWVFTNGFNHNTGVPWVESVDDDTTRPAGNGKADTAPIQRAGGTVLGTDSAQLAALPASPCRTGGGFTTSTGTTVVFCADAPALKAYSLPKGATSPQDWQPLGKPSADVAPAAAGVPLVLPPAS